MIQQFQAIFENGVLRPLTPLSLPEHSEVLVTLNEQQPSSPTDFDLQKQQRALNELFEEIQKLPQEPPTDGLSNRDHDKILYGSSK